MTLPDRFKRISERGLKAPVEYQFSWIRYDEPGCYATIKLLLRRTPVHSLILFSYVAGKATNNY
jgi:hypothetical protein